MALLDTLDDLGTKVTGEDAFKSMIEGINDLSGLKDFLSTHKDKNPNLRQMVEEKIISLAKTMRPEEAVIVKDLMKLGVALTDDILKKNGIDLNKDIPMPAILNKAKSNQNGSKNADKIKKTNEFKNISPAFKQAAGGR